MRSAVCSLLRGGGPSRRSATPPRPTLIFVMRCAGSTATPSAADGGAARGASAPGASAAATMSGAGDGGAGGGSGAASTDAAVTAPAEKRVQKDRSRCFACKKKVGLTGFECRCTFVFCGKVTPGPAALSPCHRDVSAWFVRVCVFAGRLVRRARVCAVHACLPAASPLPDRVCGSPCSTATLTSTAATLTTRRWIERTLLPPTFALSATNWTSCDAGATPTVHILLLCASRDRPPNARGDCSVRVWVFHFLQKRRDR
jgi:hypothetical protein